MLLLQQKRTYQATVLLISSKTEENSQEEAIQSEINQAIMGEEASSIL